MKRSATGGYPWKVEGDTTTFVYIKNVTDRPQQYFLQLNYAGADGAIAGTYATGLKSVPAGQTVTLDLRRLRDEQVPDARGHTIPLAATRGQLHWSMRGADNLVLIGRAEQVDTAHGLASSYACQNCCPDSFVGALASDCGIPTFPQDTSALRGTERDQDCYGTTYEYGVNDWVWIDWLSFAPSIATVDENGLATGQNVGTAGIRAHWYASTWYFDLVHGYCRSSLANAVANSLCEVDGSVSISAVSFTTTTIARTAGSTKLRVQLSASTGVPAGTVVTVEAFQHTNPEGVQLLISPSSGQNNAEMSPGVVTTLEFTLTTSGSNTHAGQVTYRANIVSITPPENSGVTVRTGPAQNNGVSSNTLTVQ